MDYTLLTQATLVILSVMPATSVYTKANEVRPVGKEHSCIYYVLHSKTLLSADWLRE